MTTSDEKKTAEKISQEIEQDLADIHSLLQELPRTRGLQSLGVPREDWPSLEETLTKSGWGKDRYIDVTNLVERLSSFGVCVHEFAREFIAKFNKLSIQFPKFFRDSTYTYHFDTLAAAENYVEYRLEEDEATLGHKICPIAQSDDGVIILLIDDIGRVFASVDRCLCFVADSFWEALEIINADKRFQQVK